MGYTQLCDGISIWLKNIKPLIETIRLSQESRELIADNVKWKNKYNGRRCFVIGNGPSLAKQDLSVLQNEYVFTVNQMMRSSIYQVVKSDFHVIADALYFKMNTNNPDHQKIIRSLHQINYIDKKPACFFPITAKEDVGRLGLDDLNVNYYLSGYQTNDKMKRNIDLTRAIYSYNTVAQYAISIAIYMGFSEIYILGCDMTGYKEVEQFAIGTFSEQTHIYEETEEDMKKALHSERSCEEWFSGFAKMFIDYRRLRVYTEQRNIQLINLTGGGILDSLPRKELTDIVR